MRGRHFVRWLTRRQVRRADRVGDLVREVRQDPEAPKAGGPRVLRAYLAAHGACGKVQDAAEAAIAAWRARA